MLVLIFLNKVEKAYLCKKKSLNNTPLKTIMLMHKSVFLQLSSMKGKLSVWVTAKYSLRAIKYKH